MSLLNKLIVSTLPLIPKPIVGTFSKRYIAGTTFSEAVEVIKRLNASGMMATLDILGEDVCERSAAEALLEEWKVVLKEIRRQQLDTNISVKPSQLGLRLDKEFCFHNFKAIVAEAAGCGNFVRIDMEDSSTTSNTIELFRRLRSEGFTNVGIVIQAYLKRSEADVRLLVSEGTNFRLCKGIYVEPSSLAFKDREEIRRNFTHLLRLMLEGGCYVGIATHDDVLIDRSYALVRDLKLSRTKYEFQMLLGVREGLRDSIVRAGHRLRVYVPYGEQWYPYSIRRLKENPQIAGYILKALLISGR
jgi:proline dehydrogenase